METVKGPDSLEETLERMVDLYQLPLLRLCYAYLHDEELAKVTKQTAPLKEEMSRIEAKLPGDTMPLPQRPPEPMAICPLMTCRASSG